MPVNLIDGNISEVGIARVGTDHDASLARHKLKPGDIVFSRRGDVTRFALVGNRESGWLCGTGCLKVSLGDSRIATPEFISGVLSLPETKDWLVQHAVGATMLNLNTGILSAIPIRLPDLRTQTEAASLLSSLKSRIDSLRQTNATLEAIAQALFKSWFVDFDPVRARAEDREPEGMDAATAALFPDTFKASRIGLIPEGWEVSNLGDQLEILSGGTPKTKIPEYWDGDIPWFSVVDAPTEGQVFVFDTERRITQSGLENSPARLLPANTTIISARGTVGKLAVTGQPMAMNQSCYGLRPVDGVGEFWTYLSVQRFVDHLQRIAHGAVFDTITRSSFSQAQAVNAPKEVVSAFEALVTPFMVRLHANGRQAITLAKLRDTLLPRLISGKIRLSEAEREIEAATA